MSFLYFESLRYLFLTLRDSVWCVIQLSGYVFTRPHSISFSEGFWIDRRVSNKLKAMKLEKHLNPFLPCLVAVGLLLPIYELKSQDSISVEVRPVENSNAGGRGDEEKRSNHVEFDSIPMGEVVRLLRREFSGVNFIVTERAEEIPVRMELRSVTLQNILNALMIATDYQIDIEEMEDRLVAIRTNLPEPEKPILRAFNLRDYLMGRNGKNSSTAYQDLDEVLHLAWAELQVADQRRNPMSIPRLMIHQKTQLLIAVGQSDQLQVIEQIVTALQGNTAVGMYGSASGMGPGGGGGGVNPYSGNTVRSRSSYGSESVGKSSSTSSSRSVRKSSSSPSSSKRNPPKHP